ncbi:hypothetical protein JF539_15350 [Labrenzia aggregata]|uniref:Uncharacterized protein n=2 Tax=Roseibium aggregatum TaxID=187304 RepID=A0A939EGF1_9HYPH|nr:hypothetical protein [Roseibium aggregatum]
MYMALGFCTAGLIGLAILPAFYRRAARLTEEALRAVNPSSYAEVRAAQDQERARHAMDLRRAERRLEDERDKSSRFHIDATRLKGELREQNRVHKARIAELEAKIAAIAGDDQAIDLLTEEVKTLRQKLSEAEKALAQNWTKGPGEKAAPAAAAENPEDASAWLPTADTVALTTITSLEAEVATLKAKLASFSPTVAGQIEESRNEAAKGRLAELEGQLVDTESRFIAAQAEVTRLSLLLDSANATETGLQKSLDDQMKMLAEENARHQSDLEAKNRMMARMSGQIDRLREDLARSPALLELRQELKALASRVARADTVSIAAGGLSGDTLPEQTAAPAEQLPPPEASTAPQQREAQASGPANSAAGATAPQNPVSAKSSEIASAAEALVSRIVSSNRDKPQSDTKDPSASTPQSAPTARKTKATKAKKKNVA